MLQPPRTEIDLVKIALGRIDRGQVTQGPAGYIKNLDLYHKIKRNPFKGFNDESNIKLYFQKVTSAIWYRIILRDLDERGLLQDWNEPR